MAARSLSAVVKPLSSAVSEALSGSAIFRRSYVVAPEWVVSGGFGRCRSTGAIVRKLEERAAVKDSEAAPGSASAWTPDPITGNYRPANRSDEIDPAELREMLLGHRTKHF